MLDNTLMAGPDTLRDRLSPILTVAAAMISMALLGSALLVARDVLLPLVL